MISTKVFDAYHNLSSELKEAMLKGDFTVYGYEGTFTLLNFGFGIYKVYVNHSKKTASPADSFVHIYLSDDEQRQFYLNIVSGGLKQMIEDKEIQLKAIATELELLKARLE